MYSPKIDERLIPPLYRLARSRRQPMTRLVAEVLEAYLADQGALAGPIPIEWRDERMPGAGRAA
jgi:hypothetical protein